MSTDNSALLSHSTRDTDTLDPAEDSFCVDGDKPSGEPAFDLLPRKVCYYNLFVARSSANFHG